MQSILSIIGNPIPLAIGCLKSSTVGRPMYSGPKHLITPLQKCSRHFKAKFSPFLYTHWWSQQRYYMQSYGEQLCNSGGGESAVVDYVVSKSEVGGAHPSSPWCEGRGSFAYNTFDESITVDRVIDAHTVEVVIHQPVVSGFMEESASSFTACRIISYCSKWNNSSLVMTTSERDEDIRTTIESYKATVR